MYDKKKLQKIGAFDRKYYYDHEFVWLWAHKG